jgi:hypothetical protein
MVRKPRSPPLSVSQRKIELEKLAVLKRTELRIADMELAVRTQSPESSRLITLAIPILVLLAYTAYNLSTKCECTCTI